MDLGRTQAVALATLASVALTGCDPAALRSSPVPEARPDRPAETTVVTERSAVSRDLVDYYARVQQDLLTQGLLRTDGGGPDTPYSQRQLVDNFIRIALYEEFSTVGGRIVALQTESRLHRWAGPIRMRVRFGDSIPLAQRDQDRSTVIGYANRLDRITGLQITQTETNANFHVFIVNEDERRQIGPALRAIIPDISQEAVNTVQNMRRSTFCLVFARDPEDDGVYTEAVAVIRGEHPDLMRASCIHEELAQGLGLSNDSPEARPSVFNDDEEFALLTSHDELLLQMLYDPRMRQGMTAREARPVAEIIAAELLGGES